MEVLVAQEAREADVLEPDLVPWVVAVCLDVVQGVHRTRRFPGRAFPEMAEECFAEGSTAVSGTEIDELPVG